MIGECVKAEYVDPTNTSYRHQEILWNMQDEFGVSFKYQEHSEGMKLYCLACRVMMQSHTKVNSMLIP